jgi:hypothetical protein
VCDDRVIIPETSDRNKIIFQKHASVIGDRKGITKTYKFAIIIFDHEHKNTKIYSGIPKVSIEEINSCKNSITHSLRNIHGHPGIDKVSMDIVGLLTTENGYIYVLTIQELSTKYSVPFMQATSSEICKALVKKFINPYIAPKVDHRS